MKKMEKRYRLLIVLISIPLITLMVLYSNSVSTIERQKSTIDSLIHASTILKLNH